MKLSLALGNRRLSAAYIDASGVPHIVAVEGVEAFPMHLWCNGSSVVFGEAARRRSFENEVFFFTDLVDDLRSTSGMRRAFRLGGRELGIAGVLALLFSRGVRDPLVRELTRHGQIKSLSERFEITLCLPDGLTSEGESSLLSALEAADFRVVGTVPEHVAAVYGYGLSGAVGRRILHLDLGRDFKMNLLEVFQDQRIERRANRIVQGLGTGDIDDLVSAYLRRSIEQSGGPAESRLSPPERYLLAREIESAIAAICREGVAAYEFRFPAGSGATIKLRQKAEGAGRHVEGSPVFAFRDRMSDFFTRLLAHLNTFLAENSDRASLDEVILSGGGCAYPFVVERLESGVARLGRRPLLCRWGYENVLAIGTTLATSVFGFQESAPTGNGRAIRDLIAPVVLEDGGTQAGGEQQAAIPAIEAGARVDIPPGTTRLLLRVAGEPGLRVRMITEGEGPVREWSSGTPAGAPANFPEILADGTVHVDVARPRPARFTAAVASDLDLASVEYTFEVRDFLTGNVICRFKNETGKLRGPIQLLSVAEIYYYETKKIWRIRGLLETRMAVPQAHSAAPTPAPAPLPRNTPPAAPSRPLVPATPSVPARALSRGERVDLPEKSYVVAVADSSLSLAVLSFSDPAGDAIAALSSERENKHGDAVLFRGRSKVGVNLAETREKRLGIVVLDGGMAPRELRLEIRNAQDDAVLYSYVHSGETPLKLPASVIELYLYKEGWRLKVTGESVALNSLQPEVKAAPPAAQASYDPGALPVQVLGGKYPVPAAFGAKMRLDFFGAFPEPFDAFVARSTATEVIRSEPYFRALSKAGRPRPSGSEAQFSMDLDLSAEHYQEYRIVVSQVRGFIQRVVVIDPGTLIGIARYDAEPERRYASPCSIVRVYRHKGAWRYVFEDDRFTP